MRNQTLTKAILLPKRPRVLHVERPPLTSTLRVRCGTSNSGPFSEINGIPEHDPGNVYNKL